MARVPFGNNDSDSITIYKSRDLYEEFYPDEIVQIDLWNTVPLYGKVDDKGAPVYPKESQLGYISRPTDNEQLAALNFVANAFSKMRDHYNFIFKTNPEVGPTSFFGNDLQPVRAWESPIQAYTNYIQDFYDELFNNVLAPLGESKDIKNFDDFITVVLDYVTNERKAFTRLAHGASAKTSVLNTGLAIEIFDGDYGNDAESVSFINDPNYPIYEELCRKYGFKIDKNIPWRMVANIRSKNLSPFIRERFSIALQSFRPSDVFKQFYNEYNTIVFFEEFVDYLKIFYTTFYQSNQVYKEAVFNTDQFCKGLPYRIMERESPLSPSINKTLEENLLLFYKFRLAELGLQASKQRQTFHVKNLISIIRSIGTKTVATQKAIEYIQYNLGTTAFREQPLDENNLTRSNDGGTISAQDQFDKRTGEDSRYLIDDLSNS